MQTLAEIRAMLEARGLRPRHPLGQNFLIDHNLIAKLVDTAGVGAGSVVLEVGPGTGTLTDELLARGCRVVACELDAGLAALLRERYALVLDGSAQSRGKQGSTDPQRVREAAGTPALPDPRAEAGGTPAPPDPNMHRRDARATDSQGGTPAPPDAKRGSLQLIEGDCLADKHTLAPAIVEAIGEAPFSLVANLPYGAATPLMMTLLIDHPRCTSMFVTLQREVADRLRAKPGTRDYGPLSVLASSLARVSLIATLPPECFWPRPDVTSAMVGLVRRDDPLTDDPRALAVCCKRLFGQRRKQLGSILGREVAWPSGVEPTARAESLEVEQVIALCRALVTTVDG